MMIVRHGLNSLSASIYRVHDSSCTNCELLGTCVSANNATNIDENALKNAFKSTARLKLKAPLRTAPISTLHGL